jgi:hypothetical protein
LRTKTRAWNFQFSRQSQRSVRDTIEARSGRGNVQLFDPAGSTGLQSSSWTPLASCHTWAGARRTAGWLAEGASASKRGLTDGDFWYAAAAKLLAPLLFAAARSKKPMADVVTWVDTQEEVRVQEALARTRERDAINAFEASIGRDDRQRSSIYTTAETVLEAYADPDVLARSRTAGIRADELLDGGRHTLYLSATVREQRRLRPVFVALIESVVEEAYRRSAERFACVGSDGEGRILAALSARPGDRHHDMSVTHVTSFGAHSGRARLGRRALAGYRRPVARLTNASKSTRRRAASLFSAWQRSFASVGTASDTFLTSDGAPMKRLAAALRTGA